MLRPSECRWINPSADRCLLHTVKLHYPQKYWIEAHQIYARHRRTVAALNALIDISIVQRVGKCQRNEWRSSADFRPITTRRYTSKKRYLRGYCTEVHKIFTSCSCIIAGVNALIADGDTAFHYGTLQQRLKAVHFDVWKKCSKLIGYHSNVLWAILKHIRLIIPTHISIKAEYMVKIGRSLSELIGRKCPFLHFFHKSTKGRPFSRISPPIITVFAHDVATFIALLSCPSPFRYSNPFRNDSLTKKIFPRKTPIVRLSLVATATSFKRLPNECKIYQVLT